MLIFALGSLIEDYRKAMRRAARHDMPATVVACEEAIARYHRLAVRVAK